MPILDSVIFPAGGAGGMAKKYTLGMTAEFLDEIRSAFDGLLYVRRSTVPTVMTLMLDPALDYTNFCSSDNSNPMGTVRSMQELEANGKPYKYINGQLWMRSGLYAVATEFARPIPDHMKIVGDFCQTFQQGQATTVPWYTGGAGGQPVDAVGDGKGNWITLDNQGKLYRSIDDGVSWQSAPALTPGNQSRLACNKNGRFWVCNPSGQIYLSENVGTSWTLQTTVPTAAITTTSGTSAAPGIFKFINGRLVYVNNGAKTISTSASASNPFLFTFPDTSSTGAAWTTVPYDSQRAVLTFANNTSAAFVDAVGNDGDIIWLTAPANNNYIAVFVFNLTTNALVGVNSFGAANCIQGMSYEAADGGYCWFHTYYYGGSTTVDYYEVTITATGAVSSQANNMKSLGGSNTSASRAVNYPEANYIRRGGVAILQGNSAMGQGQNFPWFRPGSLLNQSRLPVGNQTYSYTTRMFIAGNTVMYLSYYGFQRSPAVIGIAGRRAVDTNQVDYIRIQ